MQKQSGIVVFLCGPPCSGKTTQAKLLERAGAGRHVEPSKLVEQAFALRNRPEKPSDAFKIFLAEQKSIYNRGGLPDQIWVATLIQKACSAIAEEKGSVLFTGVPRNLDQVQALLPFLTTRFRWDLSVMLYLDVPTSVLRERARSRGRDIDKIFNHRLAIFREQTIPAIEHMRRLGIRFEKVHGELSRDTVHACILHQKLGGC